MKPKPKPRKTRKEKLARQENEERKQRRLVKPTELSPWEQYRFVMTRLTAPEKKTHNFFTRPSPTSFGSNRPRPLWQSVLCDFACLITLGLYEP